MKPMFWVAVIAWVVVCLSPAGCSDSSPVGRSCLTDDYCDPGEQCFNGECRSRDCKSNADCAPGKTCQDGKCTDVSGCTGDEDCNGARCDTGTGRCVQCLDDNDCGSGKRCVDQVCYPQCESNADCKQPVPVCDTASNICVECLADADCPGEDRCCGKNQRCAVCTVCENPCSLDSECTAIGACLKCLDLCCVSIECASDQDCPPDAGGRPRTCGLDTMSGCMVCQYVRCGNDENCGDPTFPLYIECTGGTFPKCDRGLCICEQPCGGQCPDGTYCCKKTQTCDPIPETCAGVGCGACEQVNPNPGGALNDETCQIEGADCSCVSLPPLPDAFAGQHTGLDLGLDGVPVLSGYYGQPYGDLLFGVASSAEAGATVSWTFVDGVPAGAPCVGAADGPRGGIAEPGDDVGWDTDIVMDLNRLPRISYFDRTNGDLKYAAFNGTGWNIQVVDGAGTTGRFTSMVLDGGGRPIISYMTTRENLTSYLKVARATKPSPATSADWEIQVVDSAPVPCIPSECGTGEACLKSTGTCAMVDPPANCNGGAGCATDEACVAGACEVLTKETSVEDIPPGVGLFSRLALYSDNSPAVAYYDNNRGNLKFAWWNPGLGAFAQPVILAGEDGAGNDLGNLGADVSMFISLPGDTVHLSYQDADLRDLFYMTFPGQQVLSAVVELVDVGARDATGNPTDPSNAVGELHWVGSFSSLLMDVFGNLRIAYQDSTSLDLVYATRNTVGQWTVEILARREYGQNFRGAYGFFAVQVLNQAGEVAHISNFKHNLRTDPWTSGIELLVK